MLDVLAQVCRDLPRLLREPEAWQSLHVTYHPPRVERLWRTYGDRDQYRVLLHRIYPCEEGEALFHPHPWPSAVAIVSGRYEHCVAELSASAPEDEPAPADTLTRTILCEGAVYEMTVPHAWHSVRPIDGACDSIMVTGPLYEHSVRMPSPPAEPQQPLSRMRFAELFAIWRDRFDRMPDEDRPRGEPIEQSLVVMHEEMGRAVEQWAEQAGLEEMDEESRRILKGIFIEGWSGCLHSTLSPARNLAMALLQMAALAERAGDDFKVVIGGPALKTLTALCTRVVGTPEQWQLDELVDTVHVEVPDEGDREEN